MKFKSELESTLYFGKYEILGMIIILTMKNQPFYALQFLATHCIFTWFFLQPTEKRGDLAFETT
jgi:hypothetical protein